MPFNLVSLHFVHVKWEFSEQFLLSTGPIKALTKWSASKSKGTKQFDQIWSGSGLETGSPSRIQPRNGKSCISNQAPFYWFVKNVESWQSDETIVSQIRYKTWKSRQHQCKAYITNLFSKQTLNDARFRGSNKTEMNNLPTKHLHPDE